MKLSGPNHVDAVILELESQGFVLEVGVKGELFRDLIGPRSVRARIDVIARPTLG